MDLNSLDPYSRELLQMVGLALIAIARGELTLTVPQSAPPHHPFSPSLADARAMLQGRDGDRRFVLDRSDVPSRRKYRVIIAKKKSQLDGLTPATMRVFKHLETKPDQTVPEVMEGTALARKTVENILSSLRKRNLLETNDVTA